MPSVTLPLACWYAPVSSESVGREPLGVVIAGRHVVLYRTDAGDVVALEDRCAHRPYPLSAGVLVGGDQIRCGLCGFVYNAGGLCVSVPSQAVLVKLVQPPAGAVLVRL